MAGHSHSANVAVKKGKVDRLRARVFSKLSKNIMVAARGGADPDSNFSLRHAIELARAQSMPRDKIEHATKKGAGLLEGGQITEAIYEAFGAGGVGLLIECVSDNPNRTRPEISSIVEKHGAKMAAANAVKWMFKRRGFLTVKCAGCSEERLMDLALGAGADDMRQAGDVFELLTPTEAFEAVEKALEAAELTTPVAEVRFLPNNTVEVDAAVAQKIARLIEAVEEHDDVKAVYHNMKLTDPVLALLKDEGA